MATKKVTRSAEISSGRTFPPSETRLRTASAVAYEEWFETVTGLGISRHDARQLAHLTLRALGVSYDGNRPLAVETIYKHGLSTIEVELGRISEALEGEDLGTQLAIDQVRAHIELLGQAEALAAVHNAERAKKGGGA